MIFRLIDWLYSHELFAIAVLYPAMMVVIVSLLLLSVRRSRKGGVPEGEGEGEGDAYDQMSGI